MRRKRLIPSRNPNPVTNCTKAIRTTAKLTASQKILLPLLLPLHLLPSTTQFLQLTHKCLYNQITCQIPFLNLVLIPSMSYTKPILLQHLPFLHQHNQLIPMEIPLVHIQKPPVILPFPTPFPIPSILMPSLIPTSFPIPIQTLTILTAALTPTATLIPRSFPIPR
jgi:hypothetical protein